MASRWYVLACKHRKERLVWQRLHDQGYDAFWPWLNAHKNQRGDDVLEPYFPGYIFVRLDLGKDGLSNFQWMPYTGGLVFIGEKPACVPDPIIEAIDTRLNRFNENMDFADNNLESEDIRQDLMLSPECRGTIFDNTLSSPERVNELLRLLGGLYPSPE